MFCKQCGKETEDDSIFCKHCGTKIGKSSAPEKVEWQEKVFTFGSFSGNESNVTEINEWLMQHSIVLKRVSINSFFKSLYMFSESVLGRMQLIYRDSPNGHVFQVGYFSMLKAFSMNYNKLDARFEEWKREHPNNKVVWDTRVSHQLVSGSGGTQSLFFIYKF